MTPRLIPLREHPSNLDKTATLVWSDRLNSDSIYRVKGGFVAVAGGTDAAFEPLFATETEARQVLHDAPNWSDIGGPQS